jgi:hypothetical protein
MSSVQNGELVEARVRAVQASLGAVCMDEVEERLKSPLIRSILEAERLAIQPQRAVGRR